MRLPPSCGTCGTAFPPSNSYTLTYYLNADAFEDQIFAAKVFGVNGACGGGRVARYVLGTLSFRAAAEELAYNEILLLARLRNCTGVIRSLRRVYRTSGNSHATAP